jgi:hypothetical protein
MVGQLREVFVVKGPIVDQVSGLPLAKDCAEFSDL